MFYSFLKVLVRFTLKIFYRKIFITGLEHIKTDTPQLIASNHPNGFLEPLIMACFFPKPLHFLVRGDVFDNPVLKPMLRSTNQIPIFRFRDGFSKLRENSQNMDESIQVLLDKKNLLIFAEGGTESIKKLRPLQKGISRIAFQAMEKNPALDLEILPVGINFTYPTKFNTEVMLKIGKPLKAHDYLDVYHEDNKLGHENLLSDLYDEMKKNIIHLNNQQRIKTFEKLAIILRSIKLYPHLPIYRNDEEPLMSEKNLAETLDKISENNYDEIKDQLKKIESEMEKENISLADLLKTPPGFGRIIFFVAGFIPFLFGIILHALPIGLAYYFTKNKIKQKEFKASILMVSSLILCLIYYIILIIIILAMEIPLYWFVICILCGWWSLIYWQLYSSTYFRSSDQINYFKEQTHLILFNMKNLI